MPQPSQQDFVNLTTAMNRVAAALQQNASVGKAQNNATRKAATAGAQAGGNAAANTVGQNVTQAAANQAQAGGNAAGTKFGANFTNAFQKKIKTANVSANLAKYFMNALKGAFGLLTSFVGFIIGIIGKLWQKLIDMWEWYEGVLRKVYDATGLVGAEAERVRGIVVGVTNQYVKLGVTMESAAEAAGALTEEFHNIGILSGETLGNVALLKTTLGVTEADGAKLTKIFMSMNGYSEKQTTSLIASVKQMSMLAKVAPRKVMQDIAKNSEFVYKYFRGSTQNAAKFAVLINNIGKSMDVMKGAADSLMEWDSSIENEMNASVLLGRTVDFSAARMKVFKGDMAGALDDIIKQVGSADKLSKMSIYQHKAIADATGISTDALIEMVSQQEKMNKFEKQYGQLSGKTLAQKQAMLQDAIKRGNVEAKAILTQNIQQTQVEKFKALQEELKMKFLELAQKFFPIILKVIAGLEKVFNYIGVKIKEVVKALGGGGAIAAIGDSISSMIENVGKFFVDVVADIVLWIIGHKDDIAGAFIWISDFVKNAIPIIEGVWTKIKGITGAIESFLGLFISAGKDSLDYWYTMGWMIGSIYLAIKGIQLAKFLLDVGKSAFGAAQALTTMNTAATTTSATAITTGAKLSSFLTNLGVGIWQLMEGIAQGFAAFGNPMVMKGVAILTLAVIGLGFALWLAEGAIKAVADAIAKIFVAMFQNGDKMKLLFEGVAEIIKAIFQGIANNMITVFTGVASLITAPFKAVAIVIETVFNGISKIVDTVGNNIVKIIDSIADSIVRISSIQTGKIAILASELMMLNAAMAGMALGNVFSGVLNKISGGSLLDQIKELTSYSNQLDKTASSITALKKAFNGFELPRFDSDSLDDIKELIESVSELTANSKFVINSRVEYNNKELIKKMDEMINAISDMKVVMDSREVGRLINKSSYIAGR